VAVFVADQATKRLVRASIPAGQEFPAVDRLVWLTNITNSGAAFGLAPMGAGLFLVASFVVAAGLVYYVARHPSHLPTDAMLGLILGGTLGNGFDRLFAGTVTDFIALHWWPVFNVADSAISVGVAALLGAYLLRRPGRRA